jgi:AraC-like DNA-binding protein
MTDGIMAALRNHAGRDNRVPADPAIPALCCFVARQTERIASVDLGCAGLVVVLNGSKQLADAAGTTSYPAGSVIMMPAGWVGAVVNAPPADATPYRALLITFPGALVRRALHAHPQALSAQSTRKVPPVDLQIHRDGALDAALLHAVEGLAHQPPLPRHIVEHRVMEVLLALLDRGAWWLAAPRDMGGHTTIEAAVRRLVALRPAERWTAELLSIELGTSPATLRRHLAQHGTSLRTILTQERIRVAHVLQAAGPMPLSELAARCGYASRSRFSTRLRQTNPGSATSGQS